MSNDLVVFGEDWGAHPSSTQHIVSHLAHDRQVLWINSIGLRRPRPQARDLARIINKLAAMSGFSKQAVSDQQSQQPDTLDVIQPRAICWPGSNIAARFNRTVLGRQVRNALERKKIHKPVIWTSLPTAIDVVEKINGRALVYYCGDDFSALAGVDHEPVAQMEKRLAAQADLIIAASDVLASRFPAHKTLAIPHGVDYRLFSEPALRAPDLPVGRPIAGFYGALADWIDVGMIAHAAKSLPNWDFVLIGPVQTNISVLERLPNVHLLGPRAHSTLPSYSQHWTISMLPFHDNAQIQACNPLKLREYLAAGTPIVATPFAALAPYADLARIVTDRDSFANDLLEASKDFARNNIRRLCVREESWDMRARDVAAALAGL